MTIHLSYITEHKGSNSYIPYGCARNLFWQIGLHSIVNSIWQMLIWQFDFASNDVTQDILNLNAPPSSCRKVCSRTTHLMAATGEWRAGQCCLKLTFALLKHAVCLSLHW